MEWIRVAKVIGRNGYDVISAFNSMRELDWSKSGFKINTGDIVYIYVGQPYYKIMYKTECIKSHVGMNEIIDDKAYFNNFESFKDSHLNEDKIRLKLIKKLDDNRLSLYDLKELGYVNGSIQGAISSKSNSVLFEYINSIFYNEIMEIIPHFKNNYYTASIPLSSRQWIEILGDKDLVNDEALGLLKKWYLEPEFASSCYEMSVKYKENNYYVLATVRFVKKILYKLNSFKIMDEEDNEKRYYLVLFNGWYKDLEDRSVFVWKMRTELIKAIKEAKLFENEKSENNRITINHLINEQTSVENILENKVFEIMERQAIIKTRIGQGYFRKLLLDKFDNRCVICGLEHTSLLVASHIKEWKNSAGDERHDINNGLLLCPMHDALFDNHLISFEDDGKIIISSILSKNDKSILNLNQNMKLNLNADMKIYMKYHRVRLKR